MVNTTNYKQSTLVNTTNYKESALINIINYEQTTSFVECTYKISMLKSCCNLSGFVLKELFFFLQNFVLAKEQTNDKDLVLLKHIL